MCKSSLQTMALMWRDSSTDDSRKRKDGEATEEHGHHDLSIDSLPACLKQQQLM